MNVHGTVLCRGDHWELGLVFFWMLSLMLEIPKRETVQALDIFCAQPLFWSLGVQSCLAVWQILISFDSGNQLTFILLFSIALGSQYVLRSFRRQLWKKSPVCLCFSLSVILLIRFSFQVRFCIIVTMLMRDFECITRFYYRHRSARRYNSEVSASS